mgnify:FL=1
MAKRLFEWETKVPPKPHTDRAPLMRTIDIEMVATGTTLMDCQTGSVSGQALTLNISPKGLLVLMDREPEVDQVLRILVPSPVYEVGTPTLSEVRWTRKMPLLSGDAHPVYFVGLRFIL